MNSSGRRKGRRCGGCTLVQARATPLIRRLPSACCLSASPSEGFRPHDLTGGEALVQQLVQDGETHLSGIPGVQPD